jgi:hypothetical protein
VQVDENIQNITTTVSDSVGPAPHAPRPAPRVRTPSLPSCRAGPALALRRRGALCGGSGEFGGPECACAACVLMPGLPRLQVLGVMGDLFLPFVHGPEEFTPDAMGVAREKSINPSKMKPKEMRHEQDFADAALREGAFLGTLHLPLDFAGPFKSTTDKLRRSRDRMARNRTLLENRVPLKFKNFDSEVPGQDEADKSPKGIMEMWMRQMHEKKWEIIKKCAPPKVQKAYAAAWDEKKRAWKKDVKELEVKQKVINDWWNVLWTAKEEYVRNKKETDDLEVKLKGLKEKYPNSKTLLQELCEKGCDVNAARDADGSGFTALMVAARNGNLETVEALLELPDIKVNQVNEYGANAMHYAAMYAHKEVCQVLRRAKVDRKVKNKAEGGGKTPKDLAMDEHKDLLQHKQDQWKDCVYKEGQFKVVPEFGKKDKEDTKTLSLIYNKLTGIHDPEAVEAPKEWKPGRWRISKIPDPACKLDDFDEKDFMKRWKSTAKKLP